MSALPDTITLEIPGLDAIVEKLRAQFAEQIGLSQENLTVKWVFGGPAAPYAIYVHEIPPPPAKSSPGGRSATHPIGGWKYVERPLVDALPGLAEQIAGYVRGGATLQASLRTVAELLMTRMKGVTPVSPQGGTLRDSGHVVQE